MNLVAIAVASALLAQTPPAPQPPKTPRRPVAETHHGVEVVDPCPVARGGPGHPR